MQGSVRLLLWVLLSTAALAPVRSSRAASSCPGDSNGDQVVSIDEVVSVVNAALGVCEASPSGGVLATGQTQCDAGDGILGTCPGSPLGQDGEVRAGAPLAYTDNGDGTIRDNATGLIWEKLSADASIHNFARAYSWQDAFDVKIAALNTSPCFAGQCDWRLPNRRELDSLVHMGHSSPSIDPSFNTDCVSGCTVTTCSCTQSDNYWSSTSYQDPTLPGFAWCVSFAADASVNGFEKSLPVFFVRAVRGGF